MAGDLAETLSHILVKALQKNDMLSQLKSSILQGWTALISLPRWQHNGGRDFVFYDSHPGFAQGNSAPTFVGMFCNEFRHATHIVVESAQRNVCQVGLHSKSRK